MPSWTPEASAPRRRVLRPGGPAARAAASAAAAGILVLSTPAVGAAQGPGRIVPAAAADGPIAVDGRLDETAWRSASPAEDFVQIEPRQGQAATYDTQVRILYDSQNLYIGAFCRDEAGRAGVRVRDLRRDFNVFSEDFFGVYLDSFRDARSTMVFQVNARGSQRDLLVLDGHIADSRWDTVWSARTRVAADGWTAELAIPWSSLRYPATGREWRINFMRTIRRLNETTGWSPWPRVSDPSRMVYAGELSNLVVPRSSTNLRLQPYAAGAAESLGGRWSAAGLRPKFGGDLKWAVTSRSVIDVTVNTDFAQSEVDQQVVNLTRFSLLFPERRPFFLENSGLFSVGLSETRPIRVDVQPASVQPFFSRKIGLDAGGRPLAIDGGLRFTSRSAAQSLGGLLIRQAAAAGTPAASFLVGRYVRNYGRENRIGALVTSRRDELDGEPAAVSSVAAFDTFVRLSPSLSAKAMVSRSYSGTSPGGFGGYLSLSNDSAWGSAWLTGELVEKDYRAASGYVARPDILRSAAGLVIDSRPRWRPRFIRRFFWGASANVYHRPSDGFFQEARLFLDVFDAQFSGGGWWQYQVVPSWQQLDAPFAPLPGVAIPPGSYGFVRHGISAGTDISRPLYGYLGFFRGGFFDGRRDELNVTGRAAVGPHLTFSLNYSMNRLADVGSAGLARSTHVVGPELRVSRSQRLQLVVLFQYNSTARLASWNARLAWEFRPLSYVFLVFNAQQERGATTPRSLKQVILKFSPLGQL